MGEPKMEKLLMIANATTIQSENEEVVHLENRQESKPGCSNCTVLQLKIAKMESKRKEILDLMDYYEKRVKDLKNKLELTNNSDATKLIEENQNLVSKIHGLEGEVLKQKTKKKCLKEELKRVRGISDRQTALILRFENM